LFLESIFSWRLVKVVTIGSYEVIQKYCV
jgi:hypothetical protein